MKTLLVALGILVCFGILFWLDRYYKNDEVEQDPPDPGGDSPESDSETP